jgi:hypothetical protein
MKGSPVPDDEFVNEILSGTPESWGSSEGAAESIAVEYVRALEARLAALAGESALERHPEDADGAPLPDAQSEPVAYALAVLAGRGAS